MSVRQQRSSWYLGAMAMGLALAACGGGKEQPSPAPPPRASAAAPSLSETNNINMIIDEIVPGPQSTRISGWAFIGGKDAVGSEILVLLRKGSASALYPTERVVRGDVAATYKHPGVADSGFRVEIPKGSLPAGDYQVGIYIRRGTEQAAQYTPKTATLP